MAIEILVILIGAAAAALGILVLRLGKKLALFLLALAVLAVVGAVALAMNSQAQATKEVARAAEIAAVGQATTSAAMSIIAFLLALIVILLLAIVGAVVAWLWWQQRQKRARFQEALETAQYHALLGGGQSPNRSMGTHALPGLQPAGNILVLPPAQQPPPGITLDDLARALQAAQGQGDPMAGLFPPDDEWKVLG